MVPDWAKRIISSLIENATALCMVFVCFMLFTDILFWIFPSKLTSELAISTQDDPSVLSHPHWRQLLLAAGDKAIDLKAVVNTAATVASVQNNVRYKQAASLSWEKGHKEMALFSHDALQTLSKSSATIAFDDHNQAYLGENTLVVIKQLEKDLIFSDKRSFMLLVEGALRGKLAPTANKAACLNLETPQATVRMYGSDGLTEARVVAGPDQTSTISVYQGAVEVATQKEQMTVHANQAIRIPLSKPIEELLALPRPVETLLPEDMAQLFIKKHHFTIRFCWKRQPDATGYHFMLARDSDFKDIVADTTVKTCRFAWNDLTPGTYYWRVSTLVNDIEGYFSKNQRLYMFRKLAPPELLANHPPESVYYRNQAPVVGFAWRKSPGTNICHWQLARDKNFKDIVMDKQFKINDFPQEKLGKGVYFWRVGVKEASNRPIAYSPIRRLQVVQDLEPPPLAVDIPTTAIYGQVYLIAGRTEPEAKVFVGGYQTKVNSAGDFKYTLRLKKGKNVIAVAATDPANNVTSKSQIVFCK